MYIDISHTMFLHVTLRFGAERAEKFKKIIGHGNDRIPAAEQIRAINRAIRNYLCNISDTTTVRSMIEDTPNHAAYLNDFDRIWSEELMRFI